MNDLMMHTGSWTATQEDLAAVAVPETTDTYCPIPYNELVSQIKGTLPRFEFKLDREQYALAHEGSQMFGIIRVSNGHNRDDMQLAIGLRSSYDKSISPELVAGTSVFVCDNLAFNGAVRVKRKQTINSWRDLDYMVYEMIGKVDRLFASTISLYDQMKGMELEYEAADHLIMQAVRDRALPLSKARHVDKEFRREDEKLIESFGRRSAWRLFNSFTEVYKSRNPWQLMAESQRLHKTFENVLDIKPIVVGGLTGEQLKAEPPSQN